MDAPAIDSRRVGDVTAAVGPVRYAALLDQLLEALGGAIAEQSSLHRLAGSAGTLGLPRLAAALAAAEQLLAHDGAPDLTPIRALAVTDVAAARRRAET